MEILRQKRLHELTPEQIIFKEAEDARYEVESEALAAPFYAKKRTEGVTDEEQQAFDLEHERIWVEHLQRAVAGGLYEIEDEQTVLSRKESLLSDALGKINEMRVSLGLNELELKEKV